MALTVLLGTVLILAAWIYAALSIALRRDYDRTVLGELPPQAPIESRAVPHPRRLLSVPTAIATTTAHGGGGGDDGGVVRLVTCTATTDVRGNLGPASVLLNNGTDWMQDRWQAASDLHGTNIRGPHWVQLEWRQSQTPRRRRRRRDDTTKQPPQPQRPQPVVVQRIVLDWEAAYADHYDVQFRVDNGNSTTQQWQTVLSSPSPTIAVSTWGQSPGVDTVTPLHVVHEINVPGSSLPTPPRFLPTSAVRLVIHRSATGWGVSLWRIQIDGYYAV